MLSPTNIETVLKRMIATASFTIPSPKIKENNFGCSSYLIIEIAAMTSEEHNNELTRRHSIVERVKEIGLYIHINGY
jgi:hypothetical protein